MTGGERDIIIPLQYVRALAAIAVMLMHFSHYFQPDNMIGTVFLTLVQQGFFGVDIFFVLSGYIISRSYGNRQEPAPLFFMRRYIRILSGYVPVFLLFWCGLVLTNGLLPHYDFWRSLFLIPQEMANNPVPLTWTLHHEVLFYAVFIGAMCIQDTQRRIIVTCTLIGLGVMFSIYATQGAYADESQWRQLWMHQNFWSFYTVTPHLLEFAAGSLLFYLRPSVRFSGSLALISFLLAIAVNHFCFSNTIAKGYYAYYRVLTALPFCCFLILAATQYGSNRTNTVTGIIRTIGDASYSLYLLHMPLLIAFRHFVFPELLLEGCSILEILFCAGVTIVIAMCWFRYVEHPLHQYLMRSLKQSHTERGLA